MLFLSTFLITIEYSLACLFVGALLLWILTEKQKNTSRSLTTLEFTSAYLAGQGILANIWVLLALQGWFLPPIVRAGVAILAFCGLIFTYRDILNFIRRVFGILVETLEYSPGWKVIIFLSILICMAWITSIGRSPFGDGSGFYLAIAKVISESHELALLPGYEGLTSIGLQGEMHFATLMTLGSTAATQLFSWQTMLAGTFILIGIAQKMGITRHGQWLVFAMVFSSSAILEISGSGKTDLFAAALGLSAYYWGLSIRDAKGHTATWLTGIFTGLSLVAKISYLLTLLPGMAIIIIQAVWIRHRKSFNLKEYIPYLIVFMTGLLFAIAPHLVKNYELFKTPLAPFGTSFHGLQDQTWYGPQTTRRILLTIPIALTFGDYWAQIGNISPLVLAFLPFVLFLQRPRDFWSGHPGMITLAACIGLLCWFIFRPSILAPRYFMACLLLFCLPTAQSVDFFISTQKDKHVIHIMMVTITVIMIVSTTYYINRVFFPTQTIAYLSGKLSECDLETRYCDLTTQINKSSPLGGRVFMNNNIRYWLRSDLIQCALTTEETEAYLELETSEQRWAFIYGRGFKIVPILNSWNPLDNRTRNDLKHIPEWLTITRTEVQNAILLNLSSNDSVHNRPGTGCQQTNAAWKLFSLP